VEGTEQHLDDPRLDVVTKERARLREESRGQVRSKDRSDCGQGLGFRGDIAALDAKQVCVVDAGCRGDGAPAQPSVLAQGAQLKAQTTTIVEHPPGSPFQGMTGATSLRCHLLSILRPRVTAQPSATY
jgi:hypothetical protein